MKPNSTTLVLRSALAFAGLALLALLAGIAFPMWAEAQTPPTKAPGVRYYRAENVAASFGRGSVLFAEDTNYMIHTSRRVAPGMAEVHTRDTDLIYVLQGSAVFVTGGTVVEGRTTAADEIRGRAIEGGETRILAPGDVIIVPSGTPHWFKEVQGPVLYYTIKVR